MVMLVNPQGQMTGTMDKMAAHSNGLLHRAFSVFVFNQQGQLLLQQRALGKYHSGGKWTNTCCSHPRPGETTENAAHRRLLEEMGFDCELNEIFQFVYRHEFENGLTENEYDHVLIGFSDQVPQPDQTEVENFRYMDVELLLADIKDNPDTYSAWLAVCFEKVAISYYQLCQSRITVS